MYEAGNAQAGVGNVARGVGRYARGIFGSTIFKAGLPIALLIGLLAGGAERFSETKWELGRAKDVLGRYRDPLDYQTRGIPDMRYWAQEHSEATMIFSVLVILGVGYLVYLAYRAGKASSVETSTQ